MTARRGGGLTGGGGGDEAGGKLGGGSGVMWLRRGCECRQWAGGGGVLARSQSAVGLGGGGGCQSKRCLVTGD